MSKLLMLLQLCCLIFLIGCSVHQRIGDPQSSTTPPHPDSTPLPYCISGFGCVNLQWDPTTKRSDGTPVEVSGYKVYYGTTSGNYTKIYDVGNNTKYTIKDLSPGLYYFVVTAYLKIDETNIEESAYSNEINAQGNRYFDLIKSQEMSFLIQ